MTELRTPLAPYEERPGPVPPAPADGPVERVADQLDGHHPAVAALMAMGVAYVVIAVIAAGFGLLLTNVLVADGRGSWDVIGVNRWFADRFTTEVDRWSGAGSFLGDTVTVVGVASVVTIGLLVARHWQRALFLVIALTLEVTVFLTMTLLVDRARPDVSKPDEVPPTSSYPSGHTAAAVALYVGLAALLASRVRRRGIQIAVLVIGFLPPVAVGVSRIARGMHHPSDTMAGFVLGLLCLVAAALAVSVADAVARRRSAEAGPVARGRTAGAEVAR